MFLFLILSLSHYILPNFSPFLLVCLSQKNGNHKWHAPCIRVYYINAFLINLYIFFYIYIFIYLYNILMSHRLWFTHFLSLFSFLSLARSLSFSLSTRSWDNILSIAMIYSYFCFPICFSFCIYCRKRGYTYIDVCVCVCPCVRRLLIRIKKVPCAPRYFK